MLVATSVALCPSFVELVVDAPCGAFHDAFFFFVEVQTAVVLATINSTYSSQIKPVEVSSTASVLNDGC